MVKLNTLNGAKRDIVIARPAVEVAIVAKSGEMRSRRSRAALENRVLLKVRNQLIEATNWKQRCCPKNLCTAMDSSCGRALFCSLCFSSPIAACDASTYL